MAAVELNNFDVCSTLIKAGAEVNASIKSDGKTVLMCAVFNKSSNSKVIIPLLLRNGADKNAKDELGWTAYDYAKKYATDLKGTQY